MSSATPIDATHLHALELRLFNERARLSAAKTPQEQALRQAWVAGCEREIAGEMKFLGLAQKDDEAMTDDELLAALGL